MTIQGVNELYQYLGAAWPLVIKPGVDEAWKKAKVRELYTTYSDYRDEEVLAAFQKWTEENEKFPTTKNILNEIKWARWLKVGAKQENEIYWPMDIIYDDGNEWTYGSFKREDFVNHPKNPDHLQPEEWERRFNARRRAILAKLYSVKDTPEAKYYAQKLMEQIRQAALSVSKPV